MSSTDDDRHQETEAEIEIAYLKNQLETRKVIDKAKGVLMEQGLTEHESYSRLQKMSMDTRKPMREIAEAILISEQIIPHDK